MSENENRYLFAIYSCWNNQQKAETLYHLLHGRLDPHIFHIIIVFGNKPSSSLRAVCNLPHTILDCGDGYTDLNDKTISLIKFYKQSKTKTKTKYQGLFKCDDDILPNFSFIQKFADNLHLKPSQYAGFRTEFKENSSVFNKKTNKLDDIPKCIYCTGPIYFLGNQAIDILCRLFENGCNDDDSKGGGGGTFIRHEAEDIMIGVNLQRSGIVATQVHLYKDDIQLFPYFNIQNVRQQHKFVFGRLQGGLGNQIFQAAATFAIARKLGMYPVLLYTRDQHTYVHNPTLMEYLNGIFQHFPYLELTQKLIQDHKPVFLRDSGPNIPQTACFSYFLKNVLEQIEHTQKTNQHLIYRNHLFLDGYFQNEKYFVDYKHELLRFIFDKTIFDRIRRQFPDTEHSYFIHIRRGDYVGHPLYNIRFDDYLFKTIDQICHRRRRQMAEGDSKPHFYVVTNDVPYCRQHPRLSSADVVDQCNVTILDDQALLASPLDTIYFMAACKLGGICANSSFSWWGSYLNPNEKKDVYFPYEWMTNIEGPIDVYYKGSSVVKV